MFNPEINTWLHEQQKLQAQKLLTQGREESKIEKYPLKMEKLHNKIMIETGAVMFFQYLDILNQATKHGWLAEKNLQGLETDEFSVSAALAYMEEKGIKLKPVPKIPHNPPWYLNGK